MRHVIYLHGFASSAGSTKATWFRARALDAGITFACPDLNGPDFESLSMTRMIGQTEAALEARPGEPVALIGSSLGAAVALETVARGTHAASVDALVLLAPALDLVPGLEREFGPEGLAEWERRGSVEVFHYGEGRMRPLGWSFMTDLRRCDPFAITIDRPVLVYQGTRDTVVDPGTVVRWTDRQPHATLHLLDDDHQLASSLVTMWSGIEAFLTVGASGRT